MHIDEMEFFNSNCIVLCLKNINYLTIHDKKLPWKQIKSSQSNLPPG